MVRKTLQLSFLFILLAVATQMAAAQQKTVRVNFARGAHSATKTGVIKGYATVKYVFGVGAGQHIKVNLKTSNPSMYFTFNGGDEELTEWEGDASKSGDQTVLVFLMRSEARRGKTVPYSVTIYAH